MNIAKLILHYNTPVETAALARMVPGAIIVNNGSADKFKAAVIEYPDNLGFTKNWNRVLRRLMGENVYDAFWLMNSDIRINRKDIDRIQKLMDTGEYNMLTPSFNCWMKQCRNQGTGGVREVMCMEFTAPVITKETFMIMGIFDERFNLGSGVDFDFALRAQKVGIKMYCDDGSSFVHLEHRSISNIGSLKEYSSKANFCLLYTSDAADE